MDYLNKETLSLKDLDYLVSVVDLLLLNYKDLDNERKLATLNMILKLGLTQGADNIIIPNHDDLMKRKHQPVRKITKGKRL